MIKYFDIYLEFDKKKVDFIIYDAIQQNKKGYVCVIDGNVIANTHKNNEYKKIINSSLVNLCDGSSIALLAGNIHKTHFTTYTGPEVFSE
jgi:N-acetylglucosaminyldiphosphoundecaprenol N-acetyl-beta-D-mannosaminyltransferase